MIVGVWPPNDMFASPSKLLYGNLELADTRATVKLEKRGVGGVDKELWSFVMSGNYSLIIFKIRFRVATFAIVSFSTTVYHVKCTTAPEFWSIYEIS